MASEVEPGCSNQWQADGKCITRGGLTVLNPASPNTVMERTIVEAFVKLVVCRTVTVQQVAAASGQVLDSRTTQEEDSPVILEVHRHEAGGLGDYPTRSYPRLSSVSNPQRPDYSDQPGSSSTAQLGGNLHSCYKELEGNLHSCYKEAAVPTKLVKNYSSDSCETCSKKSLSFVSEMQGKMQVEGSASGLIKARQLRKQSPHRPAESRLGNMSVSDPVQFAPGDGRSHYCKIKNQDSNNTDGLMSVSEYRLSEHSEPKEMKLSADDDCCEINKRGMGGGGKLCENSDKLPLLDENGKPENDPAGVRKDVTEELKVALTEQDSAIPDEEESIEDTSAELFEEPEGHNIHNDEDLGTNETDDGQQDVEMTLDLQPASTSSQPPATSSLEGTTTWTLHDTELSSVTHDENLTSDHDGENKTSGGKMGHKTDSVEYDTEQDMLVIDISNSMTEQMPRTAYNEQTSFKTDSEQIHASTDNEEIPRNPDNEQVHAKTDDNIIVTNIVGEKPKENADTDQAHPHTDIDQIRSEESSGQTPSSADRESVNNLPTDQSTNRDSHPPRNTNSSTSGLETEQTTAEKPDPFIHLLTNFPVLDGPRSKESSSVQEKATAQRNRTKSSSPGLPAIEDIKEEVDDDCMITAAFISPSKENRAQQHRSAPHMATSQSAAMPAAPRRMSQDGMAGSPPRHRQHTDRQRGQYLLQPLGLPQFQHIQGYQMTPAPVLTADMTSSSLSFHRQASSSHSEPAGSSGIQPSTSQASVPNFLAAMPEVSENMDSASSVPASQDSGAHFHYSSTFQCTMCSKIFMHRFKFNRHVAMCGGYRPFRCKLCGKAFNQRAHLDTHMKFHMGIKRYKCDVCRKGYVMKGDLIRHLKTRAHQQVLQSCGGLPVQ